MIDGKNLDNTGATKMMVVVEQIDECVKQNAMYL
jgi:hypothetical protein